MQKILVTLTVGGEIETEVENYNPKTIAEEISNTTTGQAVALGDITFSKNYFVSTKPVKVEVAPNE